MMLYKIFGTLYWTLYNLGLLLTAGDVRLGACLQPPLCT